MRLQKQLRRSGNGSCMRTYFPTVQLGAGHQTSSNIIKPQKERKKDCEYPTTVTTLILYILRHWHSEVCCQPTQGFYAVNSVARRGFMELRINRKADPVEAWVTRLRNNTFA